METAFPRRLLDFAPLAIGLYTFLPLTRPIRAGLAARDFTYICSCDWRIAETVTGSRGKPQQESHHAKIDTEVWLILSRDWLEMSCDECYTLRSYRSLGSRLSDRNRCFYQLGKPWLVSWCTVDISLGANCTGQNWSWELYQETPCFLTSPTQNHMYSIPVVRPCAILLTFKQIIPTWSSFKREHVRTFHESTFQ